MLYNYKTLSQTQKILYRQLYQKDFYSFVKDFWCEADPAPFIDGKIIQFYCEFFQYLCRPWLGYDGPEKEIILPEPVGDETWDDIEIIDVRQNKQNGNINLPPRHTKSKTFNVLGGLWMWLNDPIKLASISHTQGLAGEMNIARQRVLNSERFKFFFPDIQLVTNSAFKLVDNRAAELYSMNRDAMTGYGADILICDDLTNAEAARKDKEEMNNAWSFFRNTLPSRVNNPDKYIILNIQQRLAPNDVTGRIKNDEVLASQFIFVVLPAQFKKHTYLICPISGDIIEYKQDDYLWPERFGDYSRIKALVGPTVWETQYLQNPIASDQTIIKEDMIKEEDCINVPGWDTHNNRIDENVATVIYGSHDFPVKDKSKNDFLGSLLAYKINKTIYIVDCLEAKQNFTRSKQYLMSLENVYEGIINIIEDKANGSPLMTELQDDVPGMRAWNPGNMDKSERMQYASDYVQSGNVVFVRTKWDATQNKYILTENMQNLKQRLIAFPFVQHDDIVDAFTMLILYVFQGQKYAAYGKAFTDLNIVAEDKLDYDYSTTFFARTGDTWKVLDIGVKYGLYPQIQVIRETKFRANIKDALKMMKEFTPDKNVYIDSSKIESMTGMYDADNDIIIERYTPDSYEESTMLLNKAFGSQYVVINQHCKQTIADIENVRYDEKQIGKIKTIDDGFVSCLRTAINYYGDL